MSFSSEHLVPHEIYEAFLDDRMALVFTHMFDFPEEHDEGDFVDDLEVYEIAMASQVNGEHGEDVYDAGICRYSDFVYVEDMDDLGAWYGGAYRGRPAHTMGVDEETGNGGVMLIWIDDDQDPGYVTLIIDVS